MKNLKKQNISKLDDMRNIIAMILLEKRELQKTNFDLIKYGIVCTEGQFNEYLMKHPISRFEAKMAESLFEIEKCPQ